jgi:hypothetical protein
MRSVTELEGLGFVLEGDCYVTDYEQYTVVQRHDPFDFQARVWLDSSGTVWDRLYVYITHSSSNEEPWIGYNLQGVFVDAGGGLSALVEAYLADELEDESLTAEDLTMSRASTESELRNNADAMATRILQA